MAKRPTSFYTRGGLFSPRLVNKLTEEEPTVLLQNTSVLSGSAIGGGSFQFDTPGKPFKSTQQIPLDWSAFEKHTFFNSAESKVNVAFDSIINYFPFDGKKDQVDEFLEGLTGFEEWVFTKFPKHRGWLLFSGSGSPSVREGTRIEIKDTAGVLYPSLSTRNDGATILDPVNKSFSVEFFLHIPEQSNSDQVIFQKATKVSGKASRGNGFTIGLQSAAANAKPNLTFLVSSASQKSKVTIGIPRGGFRHIGCVFDRSTESFPQLRIYLSGNLIATSSETSNMGIFAAGAESLYIGSGSAHQHFKSIFNPTQTFSGSLKEIRFYHGLRTEYEIKTEFSASATINPGKLRLYMKCNEPTGSFANNNVILDSSGNSLHSRIENYKPELREQKGLKNPLIYEYDKYNPVLFPNQPDVVSLNQDLLYSASLYDSNNPNLITKLIPKHYLLEASVTEGFEDEKAGVGDDYSYKKDFPGGGLVGSPQIIAGLLFTWAKMFDEIKIFMDQFGDLLKIDYQEEGTVSNQMMLFFANYYGFDLPTNFANANIAQFHFGKDLTYEPSLSSRNLRMIQDKIWRRILVNLQHIIRSKGTIHGIKAVMRAAGINPDTNFRFREFGGSRTITTSDARRKVQEISTLINLSGSFSSIKSPFLSGSRIETGWPHPIGTMVKSSVPEFKPHGISNNKSDGLFTTASWTHEAIYSFSKFKSDTPPTQSLARMYVTGTSAPSSVGGCIVNVVATGTGSGMFESGSLDMFVRSGHQTTDPALHLAIHGVDLFDGNQWHVSFGRDIGSTTGSFASASYFIRAGRQLGGRIQEYFSTASYFKASEPTSDVQSAHHPFYNTSGSYFIIGSSSILATGTSRFLNSTSKIPSPLAHKTNFAGRAGHIRFWTKALTTEETKEHIRNFKSLGVNKPTTNFNFDTKSTGSFERLRIDASTDQIVTQSNSDGTISIFDFSKNKMHLSGTLFEPSVNVIEPEYFSFSILDPKFDERSAENKIRIQGFEQDINIEEFNALKAPVRSVPADNAAKDDTRLSIEVSAVRALNEDIVNIISALDFFDDAIGAPELQFAQSYPELERMRRIYFNRLDGKLKFKALFEFYKWFDDSLSLLIERLIPRHTNFLGINFVIEPHILERSKQAYTSQAVVYLGEEDRRALQTDLLLKQIVITFKKM